MLLVETAHGYHLRTPARSIRRDARLTPPRIAEPIRVMFRHHAMALRKHSFRGRAAYVSGFVASPRDLMCETWLKNSSCVTAQIALHRKPGQVGRVAFNTVGCIANDLSEAASLGDSASAVSEGDSLYNSTSRQTGANAVVARRQRSQRTTFRWFERSLRCRNTGSNCAVWAKS